RHARALELLVSTYDLLGNLRLQQKQPQEAVKFLREALDIRKQMGASQNLLMLAFASQHLGDICVQAEDSVQAFTHYGYAADLFSSLAKNNPKNVSNQMYLFSIFNKCGRLYKIVFDYKGAKPFYQKALELLGLLEKGKRWKAFVEQNVANMKAEIALCTE